MSHVFVIMTVHFKLQSENWWGGGGRGEGGVGGGRGDISLLNIPDIMDLLIYVHL